MLAAFSEILGARGFQRLGELSYGATLGVWWHPRERLLAFLIQFGGGVLLKASKAYYLKAISEEGETWARDIAPLQAYLQDHFPELHLSFSWYRDVSRSLADEHVRRLREAKSSTQPVPSESDLQALEAELANSGQAAATAEAFLGFGEGEGDLLTSYLKGNARQARQQARELQKELRSARDGLSLIRNLQQEYLRKGSAASLVFSLSSNPQIVATVAEFPDAVDSVVKELRDAHRFQITQKLTGGRLNIIAMEAEEPLLVWIELFLGGFLSPRQLERLLPENLPLRQRTQEALLVTPDQDIKAGGEVRESKKLLGAHVVKSMLSRLDQSDAMAEREVSEDQLPISIGRTAEGAGRGSSFVFPLARLVDHCYITGSTGSGKSYTGRVLVEEAAAQKQLSILILDPRNQAAGLLVPEDRDSILGLYREFGLKVTEARSYAFDYYTPGGGVGDPLPTNLAELGRGRAIVSFKDLDDRARCDAFADILDAVFDAGAHEESEQIQLLIVVEEAQRFTKKRVADDARSAARRAENALDRTVREGRKYGCGCIILSQTIRDFSHDSASVRQNTNTKFFLRNSDREVDYAAEYLGNGRQIIGLPPGTAMICSPHLPNPVRVQVRPPLSKVWEFSAAAMQQILRGTLPARRLSTEAEALLAVIANHEARNGDQLHMSRLSELAGITSKRELNRLVSELEGTGRVRTRKLRQRGQPRVVELPQAPDATRAEPGRERGES